MKIFRSFSKFLKTANFPIQYSFREKCQTQTDEQLIKILINIDNRNIVSALRSGAVSDLWDEGL